jgi:ubiquinol-cytochrome c reductase cytochrome c1 subunit
MKNFIKLTSFISVAVLSSSLLAAGGNLNLEKSHTDIHNEKSLQNGAKLFMNYCAGCHSIKLMRYNRIGSDLNLTDKQVEENLIFNDHKIGENITTNVSAENGSKWFGKVPPDLSLTARARGVDWIYSYLNGFYKDDSKTFGVNNHILEGASMPDILWQLKADLPKQEFENQIRDISNFLDYVGEPAKLIRLSLGWWVLGFLGVLFILSYLLKKEYWRDVKYGKWSAKP